MSHILVLLVLLPGSSENWNTFEFEMQSAEVCAQAASNFDAGASMGFAYCIAREAAP